MIYMFSSTKMEEYMEFESSGIFRVKLVAKNIALGSPVTHFMHLRVKYAQAIPREEYHWFCVSSFQLQLSVKSKIQGNIRGNGYTPFPINLNFCAFSFSQ